MRGRNVIVKQIMKGDYSFDAEVWNDRTQEGKDFVSSLLQLDPKKRLDAEHALNHPWLSSEVRLSNRVPDLKAMKNLETRLVRYAESGEFRRVVMNVIAKKATTEDILELREIFNDFDMNKDGTIILRNLRRLSHNPTFPMKSFDQFSRNW